MIATLSTNRICTLEQVREFLDATDKTDIASSRHQKSGQIRDHRRRSPANTSVRRHNSRNIALLAQG